MQREAISLLHDSGTTTSPATSGSASDRLIVFARFPEPGKTKTRLVSALGAENAARLQESLTRRTLASAHSLGIARHSHLEVRFAGGDAERMIHLYGSEAQYVPQQGDDLGERLEEAVTTAFAKGTERLIVIGTDCPDLNAEKLNEAFVALDETDVVLGPAEDGGYYLIGMKRCHPALFRDIAWSSERVLEQTVAKARSLNCKVRMLPKLTDVDHPDDLIACRRYPLEFANVLPWNQSGLISIIVAALNEEQTIAETLPPLLGMDNVEVIVADGGSADATVRIATELGAQVVSTRRGRGRQMNSGAALAKGETLLFLHADSRLPTNLRVAIRAVLERGCIAGAFQLRLNSTNWILRWIERTANLRSRFLQLPYGDQAMFLQADLFYQIGGFPNWPLMEDYELCRRLKRRGRIGITSESVTTSPRRWERLGIFRTTFVNQFIILGFHLGISPERLAAWYASGLKRVKSDPLGSGGQCSD